ncbi:extensin family protein [Halomonas sp. PR-M31]|uniref:extensin-like domain-containing protein n=1 Tax=Halomonas sp. PR-M31 TaxID=1471202 RepID=UPI0006517761|nr:extensin family protein [Halomonas sp. PR-M31]
MRTNFLILLSIIIGIGFDKQWWTIPPEWVPWQPLQVADPLTPVTQWKLSRLESDRDGCLAALKTAPDGSLRYTPLADYTPVAGCPLTNVVRVQRGEASFNRSFVAACPLALSWTLYERHRLQPLAQELFGQPISQVQHYGSFACRNIYNRKNARRSEHASASALDVAAFRLENGQRIEVLKDWGNEGKAGIFLKRAQKGACGLFGTVLGPDYNAAHANHFHLGMRGMNVCR